MMVSVVSSHIVIPSELTPTGIFPLSDFDHLRLSSHAPLLFVYRPRLNDQASVPFSIHTLTKSLSRTLVHFYPLAGQLREIQGGRFQLHCNSMGARLLEAVTVAKLDDFNDFQPNQELEQLMPKINYNLPIDKIPLLLVQLIRFRCGGFTLGVAVSRAVVDGVSALRFMISWAKITRGEGLDLSSSEMLLRDSTILDSRKPCMAPRFDHPEFSPPPLWEGSLEETEDGNATAILKITKNQVQKLKEKASDFHHPRRPYTSFEVISGVLWRCVSKARYEGNGTQPTRLSTLVNCRNRLRPPLPNAYFGNATLPTVTKTSTFEDVMSKPLSYAVGEIRQALEKLTDDYVRSALDFVAGLNDLRLLRNTGSPGKSKGNPNLGIVSWMNFSFQDADFGWGKPVYMGPGNINSEGKAFLLNDGVGDGFIVAIRLQASRMVAFKKLFYEETGHNMFQTASRL